MAGPGRKTDSYMCISSAHHHMSSNTGRDMDKDRASGWGQDSDQPSGWDR